MTEEVLSTESQAKDRHVMVNGLDFHYRDWGGANAPMLLLLHGLTGHAWEFDRVASSLSNHFRVLVVNQRGHGASSWADEYSPEVMADDISALIKALGPGPSRIIGHSMGGVNAWWFAARHPELVERLVIIDVGPQVFTSAEVVSGWTTALDAYARKQYVNPEEAVAEYLAEYTGSHQEELSAFVLNNLKENSASRWSWRFDGRGLVNWMENAAINEEAHWAALRNINCPTLLIRAGDSPFTTTHDAERMVQGIPRGGLIEIPGAGHDIHIEQREALLENLRNFLMAN